MENVKKVVELLNQAIELLNASAEDAPVFPSAEAIDAMDRDSLHALCEKLQLDPKHKVARLKELLKIAGAIGRDEDVSEMEDADINALAEWIGVAPSKKVSATVAAIKEYLTSEDAEEETESKDSDDESEEEEKPAPKGKKASKDEEAEEEEEEDDDDDSDEDEESDDDDESDEEEEKPAKKGKKPTKLDEVDDEDEEEAEEESDDDDDEEKEEESEESEEAESEIDADAIAAEAQVPKPAVMISRLEAFNSAAGDDAIKFKKDAPEKAYRKLLARLVDDEGQIAKWETPYAKGGEGWCCGLPLEDVKVKVAGASKDGGRCQVSEKTFWADDDGDFNEVE